MEESVPDTFSEFLRLKFCDLSISTLSLRIQGGSWVSDYGDKCPSVTSSRGRDQAQPVAPNRATRLPLQARPLQMQAGV